MVGLVGIQGLVAAPAFAQTGYCTDGGCTDIGWAAARWSPHAGYPEFGGEEHGMNCTNYVAWRLMQTGYPEAQLRGLGDAYLWANRAQGRFTVNQTPRAGCVAQYNYGHVAYVEQVNSDGTLYISESNVKDSGGTRHWLDYRTINPQAGGSLAVSNYIHINDGVAAPQPTKPMYYTEDSEMEYHRFESTNPVAILDDFIIGPGARVRRVSDPNFLNQHNQYGGLVVHHPDPGYPLYNGGPNPITTTSYVMSGLTGIDATTLNTLHTRGDAEAIRQDNGTWTVL